MAHDSSQATDEVAYFIRCFQTHLAYPFSEVDKMNKYIVLFVLLCIALTGCGYSNNGELSNNAADMIEIQCASLPELSAFGVDNNQFSMVSDKYIQEFNSSDNLYFEGKKPFYSWNKYMNSAGAEIAVDDQGRFRKYLSHNYSDAESGRLTKEEYNAIAHEVIQCCVDDYADFVDSEESVICEERGSIFYPCELYMKHKYAEGFSDMAYVSLNTDGTIRTIEIAYCDIDFESTSTDEITSYFEEQFQMYLDEKLKPTLPNDVVIEESHKYYACVEHDIYCCCTYTVGIPIPLSGSEGQYAYSANQVVMKL